ncbi:hypothetical protein GN244_ATG09176 [Phytophthora infestans]|uniref:Uncharacterized protein n=1 Tax=Phytophthora infestans TaxID=4787 RepID=A0A833TCF5_PHYIN|nr:hypothetical protein GN244_ATG09176 [Phytophthora infestans]
MAKHSIDQSDVPQAKAAKLTSVCVYCTKGFTTRGIPRHQKKCAKKLAHDRAEARKTRSYKFCIINESVYEVILSFLSNQTLTKMQMITGDHYQQCEPDLARYCCKCENDNPTIRARACCLRCKPKTGSTVIKEAKLRYGMTDKDYRGAVGREFKARLGIMPDVDFLGRERCHWSTLEQYMLDKCGSKLAWLRILFKKDVKKKKALATRLQTENRRYFVEALSPAFADYLSSIRFREYDKDVLRQSYQRYVELKAKLGECGFWRHMDSVKFIKTGKGNIEDVVRAIACKTA